MNTQNLTTTVLMILLLGACSNTQKNQTIEDYLATNIRSDGSKEFYYTVTMSNDQNSRKGKGGSNVNAGGRLSGGSSSNTRAGAGITVGGSGNRQRGNKGGGRQAGAARDERLSEQLEKKLRSTGFCREGWMEIERDYLPPNATIRGECNETATDRDLRNFPNDDPTA